MVIPLAPLRPASLHGHRIPTVLSGWVSESPRWCPCRDLSLEAGIDGPRYTESSQCDIALDVYRNFEVSAKAGFLTSPALLVVSHMFLTCSLAHCTISGPLGSIKISLAEWQVGCWKGGRKGGSQPASRLGFLLACALLSAPIWWWTRRSTPTRRSHFLWLPCLKTRPP